MSVTITDKSASAPLLLRDVPKYGVCKEGGRVMIPLDDPLSLGNKRCDRQVMIFYHDAIFPRVEWLSGDRVVQLVDVDWHLTIRGDSSC